MIKVLNESVQEGTEKEWDYVLSDGVKRERKDINPNHQSRHSKI